MTRQRVCLPGKPCLAPGSDPPFQLMKQLFTSTDSALFGLARSVLEAADIHCEVRNEAVSQALPSLPFAAELWTRDEDYEGAVLLLARTQGTPETQT